MNPLVDECASSIAIDCPFPLASLIISLLTKPIDIGISHQQSAKYASFHSSFELLIIWRKSILKDHSEFNSSKIARLYQPIYPSQSHFQWLLNHHMLTSSSGSKSGIEMDATRCTNADYIQARM